MGEQRTIFQTIKPESSPYLPIISLKAQKGQSYQLTQGCSPRKHIENTYVKPQILFFPTCQVRVVRFYQSSCPPPHPPPPPPPPPPRLAVLPRRPPPRLLLQFLLDHVCINFHLHFRLANSSPSSSPTSQLSAHCWTSTWELPSSVRTAGPQPRTFPAQCAPLDLNLGHPGTFPAQCAPLDLNLGPSQLSAHRWTST